MCQDCSCFSHNLTYEQDRFAFGGHLLQGAEVRSCLQTTGDRLSSVLLTAGLATYGELADCPLSGAVVDYTFGGTKVERPLRMTNDILDARITSELLAQARVEASYERTYNVVERWLVI